MWKCGKYENVKMAPTKYTVISPALLHFSHFHITTLSHFYL